MYFRFNEFINKLDFYADHELMLKDFNKYIDIVGWPEKQTIDGKFYSDNQIGLKCRKDAKYPVLDSIGSMYDKVNNKFYFYEHEFTEWVDGVPEYTKSVITDLEKHCSVTFGRIRIMRLHSKTGLSVHKDLEKRYHYVYETNNNAFFGEKLSGDITAQCYHIPDNGHFYLVDTTREHFVYNGGWEPRIHLVLNIAN